MFKRHKFIKIPKYNVGDICKFDNCQNPELDNVIKITWWSRYYDRKTGIETISYDGIGINDNCKYGDINQEELVLLAYSEEYDETVSPYERENEIISYIKDYEDFDIFW